MLMYAQDADETLPLYSYGTGPGGIDGYLGQDGARWGDLLYPYVKSTQVFNCPDEDVQLKTFAGGKYFDVNTYSYGYNGTTFNTGQDAVFGVAGRPLSDIVTTSGSIMLCDDSGIGEANARVELNPFSTLTQLEAQVEGRRHASGKYTDPLQQALNAVYVDSHVKYVRLNDTYGATAPYMLPWTINASATQ
jgi:hypothetical protein